MIIQLTEEYGYRLWEWNYPESIDQLIDDWRDGKAPLNFFNPSVPNPEKPYRGTMREVTHDGFSIEATTADTIRAHVHDADDTILHVFGQDFTVRGLEILAKQTQEVEPQRN